MEALAIHGGRPTISKRGPHYSWPRVTGAVERAVLDQLHKTLSIYDRSGIFLEFEEAFRALVDKEFALVTNSGTSALYSVYEGLDLRPGDEVIVPAYTFFATISPLPHFGVFLRQVDADQNGNIDPSKIEEKITPATKAIVITHMWGHPCQTSRIRAIANKHGLHLVEDCSHAHGAIQDNRIVGAQGDVSVWSLQGQKNITGGEGGILVTDNRALFERALLSGQYNKRARQQILETSENYEFAVTGYGLKLRAHPLAIAIANEQLAHLTQWRATKSLFARRLTDALSRYPFISLPDTTGVSPAWYAFVFNFDAQIAKVSIESFVKALWAEGLAEIDRPNSTGCIATYPLFNKTPIALPRIYSKAMLLNAEEPQPAAKRFFDTAIKLPVWAFLDEEAWVELYITGLQKVCEVVLNNPEHL
jgi:dTDP-4-amino-4,6-dideoxygalactose transaminase